MRATFGAFWLVVLMLSASARAQEKTVVGVSECPSYASEHLEGESATLKAGTQVIIEKDLPWVLQIRTADGKKGWVRRCCLCPDTEFERRKNADEIPNLVICVGADKGGTFLYGGSMPIRNNQFVAEDGQAFWMDESAKGKTFTVVSHPLIGDPAILFLYKKGHTIARLSFLARGASGSPIPSGRRESVSGAQIGGGKVTVTAEQAPVMQGKETVLTAKKGDVFDVSEFRGDWYGVLPSRGWIHKANVRYVVPELGDVAFRITANDKRIKIVDFAKVLPERMKNIYYFDDFGYRDYGAFPPRYKFQPKMSSSCFLVVRASITVSGNALETRSVQVRCENGLLALPVADAACEKDPCGELHQRWCVPGKLAVMRSGPTTFDSIDLIYEIPDNTKGAELILAE